MGVGKKTAFFQEEHSKLAANRGKFSIRHASVYHLRKRLYFLWAKQVEAAAWCSYK